MTLNYLEFDYSEDAEGIGTFETLASVSPSQVVAVHAEVAEVLAWAFRTFPDGHGPVAEGFEWDHDLQGQREFTAAESLCFDECSGRITVEPQPPGTPRHTVSLSLSGTPAFCDALRTQFDLG